MTTRKRVLSTFVHTIHLLVSIFASVIIAHVNTMASHTPTVAGDHPLSPEPTTGGRRTRARQQTESDGTRPGTDYFTLRAQAGLQTNVATVKSSDVPRTGALRATAKFNTVTEQTRAGSSRDHMSNDKHHIAKVQKPLFAQSPAPERKLELVFGPVTPSQVLSTKWHELSDDQIKSAVARYHPTGTSSPTPSTDAYHAILRAMSTALDELMLANAQLERTCAEFDADERTRRNKAEGMIEHLEPVEQAAARKVVQALIPENGRVREDLKRPSFVVCITLLYTPILLMTLMMLS